MANVREIAYSRLINWWALNVDSVQLKPRMNHRTAHVRLTILYLPVVAVIWMVGMENCSCESCRRHFSHEIRSWL